MLTVLSSLRSACRTWGALLALTAAVGSGAHAQRLQPEGVPPGARVRVALSRPVLGLPDSPADPRASQVIGMLVALDTAWAEVAFPGGRRHAIPVDAVARLYVSRGPGYCTGRRAVCALGGLAVGAAVGAGVGSLIKLTGRGICFPDDGSEPGPCPEQTARPAGIVAGGLLGLAAGALIGRERWTRVRSWPPQARP